MMTSSAASSSDPAAAAAYERLHPRVRAWIWDQGWHQLRATQIQAIGPILTGRQDVILSAATASGKTEAAWLPICSALVQEREARSALPGVKAIYVSPLKALINDQHGRLKSLCANLDLPVYRRHGDVGGADRRAIQEDPDGLLLITPESLEALFVHQGSRIPAIFDGLRYAVIDELHSFIGTERGAQLQSLLHRLELAIRRRVPRVALSATLADTAAAAEFLRPGHGATAVVIRSAADDGAELRMQLRGYHAAAPLPAAPDADDGGGEEGEAEDSGGNRAIAEHLFAQLRGSDNLVFANKRGTVEAYADLLQRISDEQRVPNEFFPHHGNLSKELREDVERRLKSGETPTTAVCTSTLEMGIDIGSADAVAQIGAPSSVAALRQRLGRSGRRGQPAVLQLYVSEQELNQHSSPIKHLRPETMQMIATVELLLEQWYEPPNTGSLHLSTLIQQVLSVIAQHSGASAAQLFSALCGNGPFARVTQPMFVQLLRDLGGHDLISQAGDGTLLPGGLGERLLNHYSFYAAFHSATEYRLIAGGKTLGSLPISKAILPGSFLVFAGRRWRVTNVDTVAKVIELTRARGGRLPDFGGGRPEVADGIRAKMRRLYEDARVPAYLDRTAQHLLAEGRANYRLLRLDTLPMLSAGRDTLVFPWRGDRVMNTIMVMLTGQGLNVLADGVALECTAPAAELRAALQRLVAAPMSLAADLARPVLVKEKDKYDPYLGEDLLTASYAARDLDVPAAWGAIHDLLAASDTDSG